MSGSFSMVTLTIKPFAKRWPPASLFLLGCLMGVAGLVITTLPGIGAAVTGYVLIGAGWGLLLPSAFGCAAAAGSPDHLGFYTGLLFAMLASAAFFRIGLVLSGWPDLAELQGMLTLLPIVLWLGAGATLVLLDLGRRSSEQAG